MGVGYSLYFRLAKYYGLLLFSIFLLSGSAWYFISTTHCEKRCLRLFGLLVLNLDALAERKN